MIQQTATLDNNETVTLEINDPKDAVVIAVDPGQSRGAGSANPPITSYDLSVEKLEDGSYTEITGSPISSSDISRSTWSTADVGNGVRITITNTGGSTGTVLASIDQKENGNAAKALFEHSTISFSVAGEFTDPGGTQHTGGIGGGGAKVTTITRDSAITIANDSIVELTFNQASSNSYGLADLANNTIDLEANTIIEYTVRGIYTTTGTLSNDGSVGIGRGAEGFITTTAPRTVELIPGSGVRAGMIAFSLSGLQNSAGSINPHTFFNESGAELDVTPILTVIQWPQA